MNFYRALVFSLSAMVLVHKILYVVCNTNTLTGTLTQTHTNSRWQSLKRDYVDKLKDQEDWSFFFRKYQ